jgi:hypothetical protein
MARKYKYFQTVDERCNGDCFEVYSGTSYKDALKALGLISKGYVQGTNLDDKDFQFDSDDDPTSCIIKTKGWQ